MSTYIKKNRLDFTLLNYFNSVSNIFTQNHNKIHLFFQFKQFTDVPIGKESFRKERKKGKRNKMNRWRWIDVVAR